MILIDSANQANTEIIFISLEQLKRMAEINKDTQYYFIPHKLNGFHSVLNNLVESDGFTIPRVNKIYLDEQHKIDIDDYITANYWSSKYDRTLKRSSYRTYVGSRRF